MVQQATDRTGAEGSGAPVIPYQRTPPTEVVINGVRCVNCDGGNFADAAWIANNGKRL